MPVDYIHHRIKIAKLSPTFKNLKPKIINQRLKVKVYSAMNLKMSIILMIWLNLLFLTLNFKSNSSEYYKPVKCNHGAYYNNIPNYKNNCTLDNRIIENSYAKIKQKLNNKINHIINGNKLKNTKLNLMQYNKGNANFENKINAINDIIQKHKPDVMCISEANLKASNFNILNNFPEHNIEHNLMSKDMDISRNILMINKNISYKRRYDLEDNITCTIWIQVNIPKKKKSILIMGGYRQWQLPKIIDKTNTKTPKKQLNRFKIILHKWKLALEEKRDTIVLMDDNIDTHINNTHNKTYNIKELKELLDQHVIDNNLTIHNNKFTRIASHQPPSCIDHIYSNCVNKIINVNTHKNIYSDHCIITAQYNANQQIYHPKFIKSRNSNLLNRQTLTKYINESSLLNSIFRYTDPDIVTNIIQLELNTIINAIAPSKKIQFKANYTPYYNNEIIENLKVSHNLLNTAIINNDQTSWREFKNFRNNLDKTIKIEKTEYIKKKFNNKSTQWKFLKTFNNKNKQQIPSNLTHKGKQTTSPRELATIANNFFIDKILKIRENFPVSVIDPIKLLSALIPRNKNTFTIPNITINQTQTIIKHLKNSNSTGHDDITNKIIKKINKEMSPHITHMINTIINKGKIPDIFKISRILPLSKPDKSINLIDSFRPINNLPCLEKILEEHIIIHLNIFLEENNILHDNHHGGRKLHSTTTALTQINNKLLYNLENNKISATLTTDLSAAYDTVDNVILLNKLEHYGIRGNSLNIFKSYLSDRKQYVEIDTFSSQIKNSPPCSVVQGGKLSGTLYTLYTNEIPLLHKLMYNDWFYTLTNKNKILYKNIEHCTVNFVDDSTNIISFGDHTQIKSYLTHYYNLIQSYYNINKLKINADKTQLLLVYKNKHKENLKHFYFKAEQFKITPKKVIKILGAHLRADLKLDTQIGKLVGQLHNRIYELKKISKFTNFQTRLQFINAHVIGKLTYLLPLYSQADKPMLNKLHKILTTAARCAIGHYCFKKSITYMLNKCKWLEIDKMISYASLKLIHNIIINKMPKSIYDLFKINRRSVVDINLKYVPKTRNYKQFYICKELKNYNKLPQTLKGSNKFKFKISLKEHLKATSGSDSRD